MFIITVFFTITIVFFIFGEQNPYANLIDDHGVNLSLVAGI